MCKPYLAHISEDGGRVQTVLEHLTDTAALAETFAEKFGAGPLGAVAGLLHDIGKYSDGFQKRIRGGSCRVDHATAGAKVAGGIFPPLAFAVAGHHGGLPDGGSNADTAADMTLCGRLKRKTEPCGAWRRELLLPEAVPPPLPEGNYAAAFLTRMLYSCLVDADYLDTERFMDGGKVMEPPDYASIPELLAKLERYVRTWRNPATALNRRRCEILCGCMAQGASGERGLYTLTAPTGGGKTVSSLAFALRHAASQGLDRVVYVIPYTSVIEQTASVFADILGEENVLAHYCGADFAAQDGEDDAIADCRRARAAENWDMPVVVTTAVQFFESLYASRPAKCRKLHNLANSVVIFDEAQTLPLSCLRPCVAAIAELVARYRVTAVLCTATRPALDGLFQEFAPDLKIREICRDTESLYAFFRRTTLQNVGIFTENEMAGRLNGHAQVLCVVNRRSTAVSLYKKLSGEGNYCLTTLLCPADRRRKLGEIRRRLKAGQSCRVVSTSLIEAGVDIDFPTAYREEAGLDSILQTAGRCNREGRNAASESLVSVFRLAGAPIPRSIAAGVGASREVFRSYKDPASQEAVQRYFAFYYSLKGRAGQDLKGILPAFQKGIAGNLFPFHTVAEQFHLIEPPARTVFVPVGGGAALTEELRAGRVSRGLYRQLGPYAVRVYPEQFRSLCGKGALEVQKDGSAILLALDYYSEACGLELACRPDGTT